MERKDLQLQLKFETSWERSVGRWTTETVNCYVMADADGAEYVWKTTGLLMVETETAGGIIESDFVRRGDSFQARATVAGVEEYNGREQIVLKRVAVKAIQHAPEPTPKERPAVVLPEGDHVRMKYSRFKKHYPDCVVVPDTYDEADATVEIVIPDGRMKPSGTRGKHFRTWKVYFADGTYTTAKAIDKAHAEKQIRKEGKEPVEIVRTY